MSAELTTKGVTVQREADGYVRVEVAGRSVSLSPQHWASIIGHVSARGAAGPQPEREARDDALLLHTMEPES